MRLSVWLSAGLVWAFPLAVQAQVATQLAVPTVTASYSDAVDITVTLLGSGTPVEGANVVLNLTDAERSFNVDLGQVATGPNGNATVRVPLVNGCAFLGNVLLRGGTTSSPRAYTLEATFQGDTLSGTAYTGSTGSGVLNLVKENAEVRLTLGSSAELGEMLTIGAQIVDPDGDAPCDRSALTGPGPATVAGKPLTFFWDRNEDGDYSDPGENLGTAMTTRATPMGPAEATVTTDTSPSAGIPRAGTRDNALQVQHSSADGQYLPAQSVGQLILLAAPPEASRTTMTANPNPAQAGSTEVTITVTLRDRFDNALGVDADGHDVKMSFVGNARGAEFRSTTAERDPVTGTYRVLMLAASTKGNVTVRAAVDGVQGSTLELEFTGIFPFGPCACARPQPHLPRAAAVLMLSLPWWLRRRRSSPIPPRT